MTSAEITAESNALMADIAERVRQRDRLQASLTEHSTREERRAIEDQCLALTAANRIAQRQLLRLDWAWEALLRARCTNVAA
jgi:hypothetical protein